MISKIIITTTIIGLLLIINTVFGLSRVSGRTFTFPEAFEQFQQNDDTKSQEVTNRQLSARITRQNLQMQTCICVPPGQCADDSPPDGSGVIDIRIVNTQQATTQFPPFNCQYGLELCCINGSYACGVRYPPIPKNPSPSTGQAAFGAYPWQAVILTSDEVYLGSGALVDENHVLTVAHKINNLPLNSYKIRLGEWDAATTNEPIPFQEYAIQRVFIHPNFNPNNLQNDIAVIQLTPEVRLGETPTVATVCLPTTTFYGKKCYISGWGKDDFGPNGKYQAIQRAVDVQVQTQDFCQTSLSKTRLGPQFIFNRTSFICAGGEAGKDACTGDGGSPLVCELNQRWYVTGLVAWGIGCAVEGIPGVYVNVLTYIPWIRTVINA